MSAAHAHSEGHRSMTACTFTRSRQRIAEATRHIPGGVSSHFRSGVSPTPLVFDRADGVYLHDIDGNRLIDYYMALGPMILGHTPEDVIAAARAQLGRGLLYGGQSELEFDDIVGRDGQLRSWYNIDPLKRNAAWAVFFYSLSEAERVALSKYSETITG